MPDGAHQHQPADADGHDARHEHGGHHDHGHGGHGREHGGHGHEHGGDGHGHGHANDRGLAAVRRYLRQAPKMWRSEVNDAVVAELVPLPGERVLDIGAGMGAGVAAAAGTGATILAVEPTPFLRRVLRARRLLHPARSRITVADGAAEDLPARTGSIDAVWAVNTMHHWVDQERAAVELARVLRPGGRVLLVDEDFSDPAHPSAEKHLRRHGGPHRHGFTQVDAEAMAALLEGAGLSDLEARKRSLAGRPSLVVTARSPV